VSDLLSRLTLEEKLLLMGPDTVDTGVGSCDCMDAGIKRFGVPNYMNLVSGRPMVTACYSFILGGGKRMCGNEGHGAGGNCQVGRPD
jgi:hypothetical protein